MTSIEPTDAQKDWDMNVIWHSGEMRILNRARVYALLVEKHERRERIWAAINRILGRFLP